MNPFLRRVLGSSLPVVFSMALGGCASMTQQLTNQCAIKNDGKSCFELSEVFFKGTKEIPQDVDKGREYLVKSCDLGYEPGCAASKLMDRLLKQPEPEVKKAADPSEDAGSKLAMLYERCEQGNMSACQVILPIFKKACDLKNAEGCKATLVVIRRMCDGGVGEMCTGYALIAGEMCKRENACACGELGRLLVYPRPPIRTDRRKGFALLQIGCQNQCGDSCKILEDHGVKIRG